METQSVEEINGMFNPETKFASDVFTEYSQLN